MSDIDDYASWLGEGSYDDPPEPVDEDEPTENEDADDHDPDDEHLWRDEPLTLDELDRHANKARVIAYTKVELEDRLYWSRLAWYFESRAMLLRTAQARR